jgi:excisionase family DNA binding protein
MSTADWLLIPAPQAAQKLGISRRSLRNRIDSGLIRSVKVGPRVYIHKTELERVVNGKPKPEAPEEISLTEKNSEDLCQRVLADVESINIFAGPNADQWNRVLARAEGERLKETR